MEKKTQLDRKGNRLLYILEDGTAVEVGLNIQQYMNGNLCIELIFDGDGCQEQFAKLTVNSCESVPEYYGYLDTNNVENAEKFVNENGLGEFTGYTMQRGYCEYPLYKFYAPVIRGLCPEQAKIYEQHRTD